MTLEEAQAKIAGLEQALQRSLELNQQQDAQYQKSLPEKDRRIATLESQVEKLTTQVSRLTALSGRNSSNSHLPPSTDGPGKKKPNKKKSGSLKGKSGRKRGAQKGHRGANRELAPENEVSTFVEIFPEQCAHCCAGLPPVPDITARRYQSVEIPPVTPVITEYRRHCVDCPDCGRPNLAPYDPKVIPKMPFGPRLLALIATLTGVYHLSRRNTVRVVSDLFGLKLSLGSVSAIEARVSSSLEPAVEEARKAVESSPVKHTDATSWLQSGKLLSLWTIATAVATVFRVLRDGSKSSIRPLYGDLKGILVSDRAAVFNFWAMTDRQICWAHLIRKFVSFSERDGPESRTGKQFLEYTGIIFEYWEQFKSGQISRVQLVTRMAPVREQFENLLSQAIEMKIPEFSGSCANMLAHRLALWNFVECEGVEPTNNHAEQQLRAFVLWRKRSFGTQSQRGNEFAERVMTVVHTARKQGVDVFEFITNCCRARFDGSTPPTLIRPKNTPA